MKGDYQLFIESSASFYKFQFPTIGKYCTKESIFVFKNGDNIASYFIKDELRDLIKEIIKTIIANPEKIARVHRRTIIFNQNLFKKAKEIEKLKLEKLKDSQLIKIYKDFYEGLLFAHGYSLSTTWIVDSDGEDLSRYLINFIKEKIIENGLKVNAPETFSILTTPYKESLGQKEEKEMFAILDEIKKDKKASSIFKKEDVFEIEKELTKIGKKLRNKILKHYKNWRWAPYTYRGPAYDLSYYLGIWSSLLRQKTDPKKEIKKIRKSSEESMAKRKELIKKLKLSNKEVKIFDVAAEIVWLKGYRKDVSFYAYYINDKILKELGKRGGFSLMQMKYMSVFEADNYKKLSADVLNSRYNYSIIYANEGKHKIFLGKKAKDFLKNKKIEKVKIENTGELRGTCAFVGKVKGLVKIINQPEEMGKMEKGNIMVAHTTFPSLVPAMKKAAAIVTDDGGITCHAAIVARELKIPCVVGVKIATKVLKDGDRVEVDAENGLVKKIK